MTDSESDLQIVLNMSLNEIMGVLSSTMNDKNMKSDWIGFNVTNSVTGKRYKLKLSLEEIV